jgi:hypothetical protein
MNIATTYLNTRPLKYSTLPAAHVNVEENMHKLHK